MSTTAQRPRGGVASGPAVDPQAALAEARARVAADIRDGYLEPETPAQAQAEPTDWEVKAAEAMSIKKQETRRLNELRAQELRAQADHAHNRRKGLPPQSALPRYKGVDTTVQRDDDGQPAGTPGKLQKWVPSLDQMGREVSPEKAFAIMQHLNDGYQFVTSRTDGRKFDSPFGYLMEIDPLDAVHREFAYGGSAMAVNPEDFAAAGAQQEIAAASRRPDGGTYVHTELKKEHGRHQSSQLREQ